MAVYDFFEPTSPFASQTLRLAAEAQQGGGDLFDIARCAKRIKLGDKEGWEREWLKLATEVESNGEAALEAGNQRTAMNNFFHANQYYRMGDVFLTGSDPKRARYFAKSQQNFRRAAALHSPTIEIIEVRSGADTYDGYFCHPRDPAPGRWPVVFLIGGADAFAEEIYFSGRQVLERGWGLLLVDTPGRGSSMYLKGIPTRPDYEVPARACIDWLMARTDVDSERIAMMGISLAGYYAPRAAAFDSRLKALVCWSGCYSILHDVYEFCEGLRPTLQRLLGNVDDATARAQLAAFSMEGLAGDIDCPTLISHGAGDHLMSVEGAKRLYEELGTRDKTLKLYDGEDGNGGAMHCSHDRWVSNVPFMLDWLEKRL